MKKSNDEVYPKNWVNLNLMINPGTNEMHAIGGDRESGTGDTPFKGFEILNKMIKTDVNSIYTITTLKDNGLTARCIGYYLDVQIAIDSVLINAGDMCELGFYPYCVIEEVKPGLYVYPREEIWFEWDYEKEMYIKIKEKPDVYKDTCGYALG